jgi:DNA-binding NarL/FixJ family response regulator
MLTNTCSILAVRSEAPIGRHRELAALRSLACAPDARLVTVTGPPRAGKTRLAIELLEEKIRDSRWHASYVDLAFVTDQRCVAHTIAANIGAPCRSERAALRQIHCVTGPRRALVVLDNIDHIEGVGRPISLVLRSCPRLVIVAASRRPLGLRLEQVLRLDFRGLPAPAEEALEPRQTTPTSTGELLTDSAEQNSASLPTSLSKRELEVLALLAEGLSDVAIAQRLVMTPRTARYHVASILHKLAANNRTHAVVLAVRRRLLVL